MDSTCHPLSSVHHTRAGLPTLRTLQNNGWLLDVSAYNPGCRFLWRGEERGGLSWYMELLHHKVDEWLNIIQAPHEGNTYGQVLPKR